MCSPVSVAAKALYCDVDARLISVYTKADGCAREEAGCTVSGDSTAASHTRSILLCSTHRHVYAPYDLLLPVAAGVLGLSDAAPHNRKLLAVDSSMELGDAVGKRDCCACTAHILSRYCKVVTPGINIRLPLRHTLLALCYRHITTLFGVFSSPFAIKSGFALQIDACCRSSTCH